MQRRIPLHVIYSFLSRINKVHKHSFKILDSLKWKISNEIIIECKSLETE